MLPKTCWKLPRTSAEIKQKTGKKEKIQKIRAQQSLSVVIFDRGSAKETRQNITSSGSC